MFHNPLPGSKEPAIKVEAVPYTCVTPNGRIFLLDAEKIIVKDVFTGAHIGDIEEVKWARHEITRLSSFQNTVCLSKIMSNQTIIIDSVTLAVLHKLPLALIQPTFFDNQLIGMKYWGDEWGDRCLVIMDLDNPIAEEAIVKTRYYHVSTYTLMPDNRLVVFSQSREKDMAVDVFEKKVGGWRNLFSFGLKKEACLAMDKIPYYVSNIMPLGLEYVAIVGNKKGSTKVIIVPVRFELAKNNSATKVYNLKRHLSIDTSYPQACVFSPSVLVAYSDKHIYLFDVSSGILVESDVLMEGFKCEKGAVLESITMLPGGRAVADKYHHLPNGPYGYGPKHIKTYDMNEKLLPHLKTTLNDCTPLLPSVLHPLILSYFGNDFSLSQGGFTSLGISSSSFNVSKATLITEDTFSSSKKLLGGGVLGACSVAAGVSILIGSLSASGPIGWTLLAIGAVVFIGCVLKTAYDYSKKKSSSADFRFFSSGVAAENREEAAASLEWPLLGVSIS